MSVRRSAFREARNYYLALATEFAAPLLRAAASAHGGTTSAPATWRKGLIIGHSHIGDVLYRTASLAPLRRALPLCQWHYLTVPSAAQILEHNPDVVRVMPLVRGDDSWDLAPEGFRTLRAERYDVALCTNTLRHHPDLILATALGIPNRVAYGHKGLSGLITRPVPLDVLKPYPAYFRDMVASLTGLAAEWSLRPQVTLSADDERSAAELWNRFGLNDRRVIACCPTTRQPDGGWPLGVFAAVLQAAYAGTDTAIVFCGTATDAPTLRTLADSVGVESRVLAGDLPLRAFASFLARCNLVFAQDSAPRHLANAAHVPVAFLRNLYASRIESGKYCEGEHDLAPPPYELADAATRQRAYASVSIATMAGALREMQ